MFHVLNGLRCYMSKVSFTRERREYFVHQRRCGEWLILSGDESKHSDGCGQTCRQSEYKE